jgi:hypothetical protein
VSALRRSLRWSACAVEAVMVPLLALAAGLGWLYALYRHGWLDLGPHVPDALPLEALAGHSGQPVLRFAVAWLTVGAAAGLVLRGSNMDPRIGLPAFAVGSAVALVGTGALSDALTTNQPVLNELLPQLASSANLGAWTALSIGAGLANGIAPGGMSRARRIDGARGSPARAPARPPAG